MSKRQVIANKTNETPGNLKHLTARFIKPEEYFYSFLGAMPNPDEVLRDANESIEVFRSMKSDPRVKSLLKISKSATLNYPIVLDQSEASDEVYGFVSTIGLEAVNPYQVAKRLLSSLDYGYGVAEVVWKQANGYWIPDDVVARKPERFAFDAQGRLKLRTKGDLVDLYDQPYKWLVHRHDKDAENPYGTSVLSSCYWAWKFKKAGAEFWLMATEKFAVPSLWALFESSEGADELSKRAHNLAGMLMQAQSGSGGALANVKEIKEIGTSDKLSEFKTLMDWCDTQIAYGIVYQSLAVQEAENGTRAQAQVHQGTFSNTIKGSCRDLEESLQPLIDWIVELNFGKDEPAPKIQFELDNYASWDEVRDAIDRGLPVSKKALYARYGIPEPEDESDTFVITQTETSFGLADSTSKKKAYTKNPTRKVMRF